MNTLQADPRPVSVRDTVGPASLRLQRALVILLLGSLAAAPSALAGSVDLVPTTAVTGVVPGDVVAFDIVLDFSDEPTLGGGFDLTFDESQLSSRPLPGT